MLWLYRTLCHIPCGCIPCPLSAFLLLYLILGVSLAYLLLSFAPCAVSRSANLRPFTHFLVMVVPSAFGAWCKFIFAEFWLWKVFLGRSDRNLSGHLMEKPYSSLVVTKSLPEMGLNDWDYEAPSQPLPFAGVDIRNSIIAGKHWAPEEAEHDAVSDPSCQREEQGAEHHAVSDPSCQREAGCMPPPRLDFHTNPTIQIRPFLWGPKDGFISQRWTTVSCRFALCQVLCGPHK